MTPSEKLARIKEQQKQARKALKLEEQKKEKAASEAKVKKIIIEAWEKTPPEDRNKYSEMASKLSREIALDKSAKHPGLANYPYWKLTGQKIAGIIRQHLEGLYSITGQQTYNGSDIDSIAVENNALVFARNERGGNPGFAAPWLKAGSVTIADLTPDQMRELRDKINVALDEDIIRPFAQIPSGSPDSDI